MGVILPRLCVGMIEKGCFICSELGTGARSEAGK